MLNLQSISICITKNVLESQEQWISRLLHLLKKKTTQSLSKIILIISSRPNDLNGQATHCKNINEAITHILSGQFKIIFMCSNKRRFNDILQLLKVYPNIHKNKQLPINIIHDEAHNRDEGIPSKRSLIDNILLSSFVQSYTPVTASYETIIDDKNPLWLQNNLDKYSIDYTNICTITSSDATYSSIQNAENITWNQIRINHKYTPYQITQFDADLFDHYDAKNYTKFRRKWQNKYIQQLESEFSLLNHSTDQLDLFNQYQMDDLTDVIEAMVDKKVQEDKDRRRKLEFCAF